MATTAATYFDSVGVPQDADARRMTLPSPKSLLANAGCLLLLAWLYGGDVRDALLARSSEVASSKTETVAWGSSSSWGCC